MTSLRRQPSPELPYIKVTSANTSFGSCSSLRSLSAPRRGIHSTSSLRSSRLTFAAAGAGAGAGEGAGAGAGEGAAATSAFGSSFLTSSSFFST